MSGSCRTSSSVAGRDLAVKCPLAEAFTREDQKANFTKECESWIELGLHPHIASCFYVKELGGILRIFVEYVDAGNLKGLDRARQAVRGRRREAGAGADAGRRYLGCMGAPLLA